MGVGRSLDCTSTRNCEAESSRSTNRFPGCTLKADTQLQKIHSARQIAVQRAEAAMPGAGTILPAKRASRQKGRPNLSHGTALSSLLQARAQYQMIFNNVESRVVASTYHCLERRQLASCPTQTAWNCTGVLLNPVYWYTVGLLPASDCVCWKAGHLDNRTGLLR